MELIPEKYDDRDFTCEFTKELDKEFIRKDLDTKLFHHYLLYFNTKNDEIVLALRLPGRTVGGVWVNSESCTITRIEFDFSKSEPEKENRIKQKFIGVKIDNLKELL